MFRGSELPNLQRYAARLPRKQTTIRNPKQEFVSCRSLSNLLIDFGAASTCSKGSGVYVVRCQHGHQLRPTTRNCLPGANTAILANTFKPVFKQNARFVAVDASTTIGKESLKA